MKTIEDMEHDCPLEAGCCKLRRNNELKEAAREWIIELETKRKEHWVKLSKYGYVDFPKTNNEDAYGFEFEGIRFADWHEASDVEGAVLILKKVFDLEEEKQ